MKSFWCHGINPSMLDKKKQIRDVCVELLHRLICVSNYILSVGTAVLDSMDEIS
jgi:hypothetical protein